MSWLIVIPAWGERCLSLLVDPVFPAVRAALGDREARFLVFTDDVYRAQKATQGLAQVFPIRVSGRTHIQLGVIHRQALTAAKPGEFVAFVNADMVPSVEVFAAAERRFAQGKRLIMMAATRTIGGRPQSGMRSADLLRWTMKHVHPAVAECFWDTGRSSIPWAIYFCRGEDVTLHGFHLHPFAAVKDKNLSFRGITIDKDLADGIPRENIHVVTDKDEAAFAEMSPPERIFNLLNEPFDAEYVLWWAHRNASPVHRWMFTLPITITGQGGIDHLPVCEDIVKRLATYRPPPLFSWRNWRRSVARLGG